MSNCAIVAERKRNYLDETKRKAKTTANARTMTPTKCPKCGQPIVGNVTSCPECGASVAPRNKTNLVRLAGILLITILAGLILSVFIQSREPAAPVVSAPPSEPVPDLTATKAKAEGGDTGAQFLLGEMYLKGNGVPQSYDEAAKWYRQAADQGHAGAQCKMGEISEAGRGVKQDRAEAAKWYRRGAEQGHINSQYSLAVLYVQGTGVPHDEVEAVKWYRAAADQGDALAQYNLGQRHTYGQSVPKDFVEAFKWLSLSAKQGLRDSVNALNDLKPKMTGAQISEGQRRAGAFVAKKSVTRTP